LSRPWAVPGTPGLEHRVGGIEKAYDSGNISYDPENHQKMTDTRLAKIDGIADDIPPQTVALGDDRGELAVVGWGSTYGPIHEAVRTLRAEGRSVSHIHIRYLKPFPRNLGSLLKGFKKIVVPEMNAGQLVTILRSEYLVPAERITKVKGKPFKISELAQAVRERLEQ
jgi:2-oxoglutarate ferredoxin oxidoreductase subunit alpha